eukprot:1148234-Pelagomonas_calceolata.AAC.1
MGSAQEGVASETPTPHNWSMKERGGGQHGWGAHSSQDPSNGQAAVATSPVPPRVQGWGPVCEGMVEEGTDARIGSWSSWQYHPYALAEVEPNDAHATYSRNR